MERIEDNRHNRVIPSDRAPDGYYPQTVEDKLLSRSLNRKLDIFLLPFLSLLYLFNGLDRGSIGNAATQSEIISVLHSIEALTGRFLHIQRFR
jgi:hypothetical protein